MEKLFKNWVFTLVVTIVLLVFGILMFTPIGTNVMNYIILCGIAVYAILVLLYDVFSYRGMGKLLAVIEFLLILILMYAVVSTDFGIFNTVGMNRCVGGFMWLRAVVEIMRLYAEPSRRGSKPSIGLGKMVVCIFAITMGTALIFTPPFKASYVQVLIGAVSLVTAVLFALYTIRCRRNKNKVAKKEEKNNAKDISTNTPANDTKGKGQAEQPKVSRKNEDVYDPEDDDE